MFSFGTDARAARIAGEFYVNAVNVMRGAEAVSTYAPIDEAEKFRIEYWELEEAKLRRPPPRPLAGCRAFVTGAASGIGRAIAARLGEGGPRSCSPTATSPAPAVAEMGARPGRRRPGRRQRRGRRCRRGAGGVRHLRRRRPGGEQRRPVDLQAAGRDHRAPTGTCSTDHGPRSFLVSREAARVMEAQGLPADIVYVVSKNAVVAGKDNVAYGAAKADQAHQVRLLATELGPSASGSTA